FRRVLFRSIRFCSQLRLIVVSRHQLGTVVSRNVFTFSNPRIVSLLTEAQSPVEGRRVVVNQFRIRVYFAYVVHHVTDFVNSRNSGFDPQQVSTSVDGFDTVEYATLVASAFTELEQTRRQTLRTNQFAVTADQYVAFFGVSSRHFFNVQVGVVYVTLVAYFVNHSDLLGQASTFRVSTGNDDTVVHTHFQERVTQSADFRVEVSVRNGHFTVLVTTLLLVSNLVFDLQGTSTGFDHFLSQQVSGFFVTETSVDVSDDRYDVSFVVVDLGFDVFGFSSVTSGFGSVQFTEQHTQFTGVSLTQELVQFFDQVSNHSFFVHRLVRQRAEVRTQCSNHPARQVQVFTFGSTEVLLDGDQFLLTNKTVPATQRLSVFGFVFIELSHVTTHDGGGVLSDVQTGFEFVLQTHTGYRLCFDSRPLGAVLLDQRLSGFDFSLV